MTCRVSEKITYLRAEVARLTRERDEARQRVAQSDRMGRDAYRAQDTEADTLRTLATQLVGALRGVRISEDCWCPKDTDWTQSCDDANAAIAAAKQAGIT